MYQANRAI